ncbi:MAG: 50S ribosomal protein L23 [Chromatiaceae bacterium]|jgi:large subunit ribosomal protein L23
MNEDRLMQVLLGPVVSEKAAAAAEASGQYTFRVLPDATKPEIGRAVESLFGVEVDHVQVVNVKGKRKRFGQRYGKRKDWRKAYVRLKAGHEIDFGGGA